MRVLLAGIVLAASVSSVFSAQDQRLLKAPDNSFSVKAPAEFTSDGPKQLTTKTGISFTTTFYSGWNNDSYYFVQSSTYPFTVVPEDLQRALDGYASELGGKVTDTQDLTVSGQPALEATVTSPEVTFRYLVTFRGTHLFQLAYSGTPFDSPEVQAFLESISIN